MSMLDSFLNKGFKSSKCKTLLKLTIPRIKLLRNRKELHIKQMRRDIAKLLETGQEATARIRVEHIIREENMIAAQEIIELFCELISVRLPIIESQRECPLDLKEAISSICFAAPRCADLPELLQVQLAFLSKYGKEFVAAASELLPDCRVNRQIVELLSVCAPSAEKKLKLLKEIAEENEVDWDPALSETELFKSHEDLMNGLTQLVSRSKVLLPKDNDEILRSTSVKGADEHSESEEDFDESECPEAPKVSLRTSVITEIPKLLPSAPHPEPYVSPEAPVESEEKPYYQSVIDHQESPKSLANAGMTNQSEPFTSPLSPSPASAPANPLKTKFNAEVDLYDVLAAARAAAESADLAATAAWAAASLVELRMSEIGQGRSEQSRELENPFHDTNSDVSAEKKNLELQVDHNPLGDNDVWNPRSANEELMFSYPNMLRL